MRWFESSRPCHISREPFKERVISEQLFNSSDPPYRQVLPVSKMMVFTGNANPELARSVERQLHIPLGDATVGQFSDGEIMVEINENVRGKDIFVIAVDLRADQRQPDGTGGHGRRPAPRLGRPHHCRGSVLRLLRARIAACARRAYRSARKVVADMMTSVGVDRVLTVDLHADQIQGFFDVPVDNVYGSPVLLDDIAAPALRKPDGGLAGYRRRGARARRGQAAWMTPISPSSTNAARRRMSPQVMHIIGDVKDRTCVLVDDMVDTAGTLCKAAKALKEHGAEQGRRLLHPPGAVRQRHRQHRTIAARRTGRDRHDSAVRMPRRPARAFASSTSPPLLAEAMRRVSNEESISAMFR